MLPVCADHHDGRRLLPWRSPMGPREGRCAHRPVTKTWAKGRPARAAARAPALFLDGGAPARCRWHRRRAAAENRGCVSGEGLAKAVCCQRQRKTLRPHRSPPDWLTPGPSALGHGEQASIAAQAGSRQVGCGLAASKPASRGPADRSLPVVCLVI